MESTDMMTDGPETRYSDANDSTTVELVTSEPDAVTSEPAAATTDI